MDEGDRLVRNVTYGLIVELGRVPHAPEVSAGVARPIPEIEASWRRLHDAHALVLHAGGGIRMANPFSGVPTAHRVHAAGRSWFANCAWDAFGICAALGSDGEIDTACPCCGVAIAVDVRDSAPSDASLLFHCLVPAASWWDDIGFT